MSIRVTIKHDEPEAAGKHLKVTVVTVGNSDAQEHQVLLDAGQATTVQVGPGQFVMVDDKEA